MQYKYSTQIYRAVNSHTLSVSLTSEQYFSRSHVKHVKISCMNAKHPAKHVKSHALRKTYLLLFTFSEVKTDAQFDGRRRKKRKRTAKYQINFFSCFGSPRQAILKSCQPWIYRKPFTYVYHSWTLYLSK